MMRKNYLAPVVAVMIICLVFFTFNSLRADAAQAASPARGNADVLIKLGILPPARSNWKLQENIKKWELISMVIRLMGVEDDADVKTVKMDFTDLTVRHPGFNDIRLAVKYRLIFPESDNSIRADVGISFKEARDILMRSLGYEVLLEEAFANDPLRKNAESGIGQNLDPSPAKLLTRGDAVMMVYNALTVDFYSTAAAS